MTIDLNDGWIFRKDGYLTESAIALPHDAMLHEERSAESGSGAAGAYFKGGRYEYEKKLVVPEEWKDREIVLFTEGIYPSAEIYVNDMPAGTAEYGYSEYRFRIDKLLRFGSDNTILIRVDNTALPNSRWYSGAGLYRPVHLCIRNKVHLLEDDIRITTQSIDPAVVHIEVPHEGGKVKVMIRKADAIIAAEEGDSLTLSIPDAKLWSSETPDLYNCEITLFEEGRKTDYVNIPFGIRSIAWSSKGLFINGKSTLLKGGCIHHDNGILGACTYPEAEERRIRIMKSFGYNAVRCAHNPCSRALLDACDRIGMYVMDESWDMWYRSKTKYDYALRFEEHYEDDLRAMVKKDFCHPSVIFYSVGNEISEPAEKKGMDIARNIVTFVHAMDATRPVTAGINLTIIAQTAAAERAKNNEDEKQEGQKRPDLSSMDSEAFNKMTQAVGNGMNAAANGDDADKDTSPILDLLDIAGYNYASGRYPLEGTKHPNRVIFGSETFPQDIWKNWKMVKQYPYLIGDFMWTGWDYMGEAGCGAWSWNPSDKGFTKEFPWMLAGAGAIDITGSPTGEALYARTVWEEPDRPEIAVRPVTHAGEDVYASVWRGTNAIPSWSWQGCEGKQAIVEVYSAAFEIQLFLNGEQVGAAVLKEEKCEFTISYEPGKLEAVAYDESGKETGRSFLRSASGEIRPAIYFETGNAKPGQIVYADIYMADCDGIMESAADQKLTLRVDGGELLGFGSAAARTEESYMTGVFTTLYGHALAAIRAGSDKDRIALSVTGEDGKNSFKYCRIAK